MRTVLTTAAALFLFVSGDALADWREASSDHFVIYAEEDAKEIRKYSKARSQPKLPSMGWNGRWNSRHMTPACE